VRHDEVGALLRRRRVQRAGAGVAGLGEVGLLPREDLHDVELLLERRDVQGRAAFLGVRDVDVARGHADEAFHQGHVALLARDPQRGDTVVRVLLVQVRPVLRQFFCQGDV